jgi:hypothetical protein
MWLKHVKTKINHPINRRYKQFPNNRFLETQMLLIKSPISGEPKFLEVQSPMAPIPTAETSVWSNPYPATSPISVFLKCLKLHMLLEPCGFDNEENPSNQPGSSSSWC